MRKKVIILTAICVMVLVAVFFDFYVFRSPMQQNTSNTTVIDGNVYSTEPTPYGCFLIGYFTLLPEAESQPSGGMLWHNQICWLLTPIETMPSASPEDLEVVKGNNPFAMMDPDPSGQVMINGWLYSQIQTNLIEFTMPQLTTITLWTYTANEPIPTNAQILH
jgi:hypothetical protein